MTTDPIKALKMGQPFAWVIPGDDNVRHDGWLDARIDQHGEFSKPLYSLEQIIAAIEALTPIAEGTSVVVPVVPTEAMLHAYQSAIKNHIRSLSTEERALLMKGDFTRIKPYEKAKIRYRAMIAAAPASPVVEDVVERMVRAFKAVLLDIDFLIERGHLTDIRNDMIYVEARAALAAIGRT